MNNQNQNLFILITLITIIIIVNNISTIIENTYNINHNNIEDIDNKSFKKQNKEQLTNLRTSLKGTYGSSILLLLSIIISSIISTSNLHKNTLNYTYFLSIIVVIIGSLLISNIANIKYRNTNINAITDDTTNTEFNKMGIEIVNNWVKKVENLINILSDIKMYDTIWLVILSIQMVICIVCFIISIVSKKTMNMVTYKTMGLVILMVFAPMLLNFIPKMVLMLDSVIVTTKESHYTQSKATYYLRDIKSFPLFINYDAENVIVDEDPIDYMMQDVNGSILYMQICYVICMILIIIVFIFGIKISFGIKNNILLFILSLIPLVGLGFALYAIQNEKRDFSIEIKKSFIDG